jgi:hypothetical protein
LQDGPIDRNQTSSYPVKTVLDEDQEPVSTARLKASKNSFRAGSDDRAEILGHSAAALIACWAGTKFQTPVW